MIDRRQLTGPPILLQTKANFCTSLKSSRTLKQFQSFQPGTPLLKPYSVRTKLAQFSSSIFAVSRVPPHLVVWLTGHPVDEPSPRSVHPPPSQVISKVEADPESRNPDKLRCSQKEIALPARVDRGKMGVHLAALSFGLVKGHFADN